MSPSNLYVAKDERYTSYFVYSFDGEVVGMFIDQSLVESTGEEV